MYSKVNYTIVGIFVVVFFTGVLWFAFWLAKYGLQEDYSTYKIEMTDSVAGLSKDSSVKLQGVDIGRVKKIEINTKDIRKVDIYVDIKTSVPIKEDMVASTKMLGVTGLLSIEIDGGTNASKTLHPTKEHIPLIAYKPSLLTNLSNNLGDMSKKLNKLLTQSEELLSSKNLNNIEKILNNVQRLSKKAEALEDDASTSLKELDDTLKSSRVVMKNANEKFTHAVDDFSQIKKVSIIAIEKIFETSKNMNRLSLKVERSLDRGDYSLKKILEPAVVDSQILMDEILNMSRQLSENPSDLIFKSRKSIKGPGE